MEVEDVQEQTREVVAVENNGGKIKNRKLREEGGCGGRI